MGWRQSFTLRKNISRHHISFWVNWLQSSNAFIFFMVASNVCLYFFILKPCFRMRCFSENFSYLIITSKSSEWVHFGKEWGTFSGFLRFFHNVFFMFFFVKHNKSFNTASIRIDKKPSEKNKRRKKIKNWVEVIRLPYPAVIFTK